MAKFLARPRLRDTLGASFASSCPQHMGCAGSSPREPPPEPTPQPVVRRRGSASAQGGIDPRAVNINTLPKVLKDEAALERIKACVASNPMISHVKEEYKKAVIDAMKEVRAAKGDKVITQGELGDFWYVVDKGSLETWKSFEGQEQPKLVKSYAVGDSFGELALMFNQRRAASVIATDECVLWAVDQVTFKAVMCAPRSPLHCPANPACGRVGRDVPRSLLAAGSPPPCLTRPITARRTRRRRSGRENGQCVAGRVKESNGSWTLATVGVSHIRWLCSLVHLM